VGGYVGRYDMWKPYKKKLIDIYAYIIKYAPASQKSLINLSVTKLSNNFNNG